MMADFYEYAITYSLSPEESEIVQSKILKLLERQVAMYTGGSSSSVPIETALELMQSLIITLEKAVKSPKELVDGNLNELLTIGRAALNRDLAEARELWQQACLSAPDVGSISLIDTLKSIGGFFNRYDLRYFAHHLPCDIDYQLCLPVPDSLCGVDYLTEYLRRLSIENIILKQFEKKPVISLLERSCRDFRGLLVNICEPVITNAFGLVIIGKQPFELEVSNADLKSIADVFEPLPRSEAIQKIDTAGRALCKLILVDDSCSHYILNIVANLFARINTALSIGGLRGIFA